MDCSQILVIGFKIDFKNGNKLLNKIFPNLKVSDDTDDEEILETILHNIYPNMIQVYKHVFDDNIYHEYVKALDTVLLIGTPIPDHCGPCLSDGDFNFNKYDIDIVKTFNFLTTLFTRKISLYSASTMYG